MILREAGLLKRREEDLMVQKVRKRTSCRQVHWKRAEGHRLRLWEGIRSEKEFVAHWRVEFCDASPRWYWLCDTVLRSRRSRE